MSRGDQIWATVKLDNGASEYWSPTEALSWTHLGVNKWGQLVTRISFKRCWLVSCRKIGMSVLMKEKIELLKRRYTYLGFRSLVISY